MYNSSEKRIAINYNKISYRQPSSHRRDTTLSAQVPSIPTTVIGNASALQFQRPPALPSRPVIQACYLCGQNGCNYGEVCHLPTVANEILGRHSASLARNFQTAKQNVTTITPYTSADFEDEEGTAFRFDEDHPSLTRYSFHQNVITSVFQNHPYYVDPADQETLYPCPYCGWDYPSEAMQIDHIVPWKKYASILTGSNNLAAADAWKVYVACNDTNNLTLACAHCNESKQDIALTAGWLNSIRTQAAATGGFSW